MSACYYLREFHAFPVISYFPGNRRDLLKESLRVTLQRVSEPWHCLA